MQNLCALYSIIAVRLYWIQHISRLNPQNSANNILTKDEWQVLTCAVNKTRNIPPEPPTLREAVHMIAKLGGFLGRKGDKEPGMITIWRGWTHLQHLVDGWKLFQISTCG
jgi:hypothetical protein